eukprot:COSAG06_NODE_855_length_11931_cov_20.218813_3_plen_139_part_00
MIGSVHRETLSSIKRIISLFCLVRTCCSCATMTHSFSGCFIDFFCCSRTLRPPLMTAQFYRSQTNATHIALRIVCDRVMSRHADVFKCKDFCQDRLGTTAPDSKIDKNHGKNVNNINNINNIKNINNVNNNAHRSAWS